MVVVVVTLNLLCPKFALVDITGVGDDGIRNHTYHSG